MTSPAELTLLEKAALLSGENVWDSRPLPRVGLRSVRFSDGPHGLRKQVGSADHLGINGSQPATCFPTAATVANSWDPELAEQIGAGLGREAHAQAVDVLLGPGLNTKRNPLCGRNFEYFSEDPYLAGTMAAGYIRGIQSAGVSACPKHFAVNSQELRRMASNSVVDERTLREIYLTGFEIAVRQGNPWSIMTSYNRVNGTYANENRHLLTEILRDQWGFTGMVVTDWGGGNDPVAAVPAGGGVEMPSPGYVSARQIVQAVKAGELSEDDLDARVAEVLKLVESMPAHDEYPIDEEAGNQLARKAASESIVLLRNQDNALPLASGTSVALIGDMADTPRYQGAGSSLVNSTRLDSALSTIGESTLNLAGYAPGYQRDGTTDQALVDQARELAATADAVVVFVGLDELSESEGADRTHMRLPGNQIDLVNELAKVSTKLIVVLSAGSAVETSWASSTQAVVHAYLSGQAGAGAIWDVLTGIVNPSGKLAESYPERYDDVPSAGNYPEPGPNALYSEGLFVGYRYYNTTQTPVSYCFGHGLSYSTFEYSDLSVDDQGTHFAITNTSDRDGAEVAQLYIGATDSTIVRPAHELKGFTKVRLAAGETKQVTIGFDDYSFRYFDVASGEWAVEAGDYQISIGASSRDIRLNTTVHRDGIIPTRQDDPLLSHYASGQVKQISEQEFAALFDGALPTVENEPRWLRANDPLLEMSHARNPLARTVYRVLQNRKSAAEKKGHPDLNLLFLTNMPFRAIGKMTGGMVSDAMVDDIVGLVNGKGGSLRHLVKGFFANRKQEDQTRNQLH